MEITKEQYAAICFMVLMDHHGTGYKEAHPNYVAEKLPMLNEGYDAINRLDMYNRLKVQAYLDGWGYVVPEHKVN